MRNIYISGQHFVSLRLNEKENEYMKRTMGERPLRIAIGPYILRGCGPMIDLLITEKKRDGRRYLTFPKGAHASVGEVLNIIRPVNLYSLGFSSYRGVMKVIGKVRVLGIAGDDRVEVQLLDGKLFGGTCVERINSE